MFKGEEGLDYGGIARLVGLHFVLNCFVYIFRCTVMLVGTGIRYGDGAGNTIEENSSIFSLIRMC